MFFSLSCTRKIFTLIELFKVIKGLNDFCKIHCKKDGIFIQIMDDAHISLLEVNIKSSWFDEFACNVESIAFNSKTFTTIMGLYTLKSKLTVNANDEILNITLMPTDKFEKIFEIPLIDLDSDIMETGEFEHSLDFSIRTKKLETIFTELQSFGDNLKLIYINDVLYMKSHGDDAKYTLKITNDLLDDLTVEEELKMVSNIPLKYATLITKMSSALKSVTLHVSQDQPITFEMENDDTIEKDIKSNDGAGLKIKFLVAPKIDDDAEFDFSEFETEEHKHTGSLENEIDKYKNEIK